MLIILSVVFLMSSVGSPAKLVVARPKIRSRRKMVRNKKFCSILFSTVGQLDLAKNTLKRLAPQSAYYKKSSRRQNSHSKYKEQGNRFSFWNVGMMEYWKNGFRTVSLLFKATEPIIMNKFFVLNPIIPLFQSSNIPVV